MDFPMPDTPAFGFPAATHAAPFGIEDALRGVFMNADSGFDAQVVHKKCEDAGIEANIHHNTRNTQQLDEQYRYFDERLYKRRFVIERMNAWLDSFKALLIRFETRVKNWMALHFLAFTVWMCRKTPNVKY